MTSKLKTFTKLLPIFASTLISCGSGGNIMTLEKKPGVDFKILQLTDIQIIDGTQLPYPGRISDEAAKRWSDRDKCAFNLVRQIVKDTDPDYIVLTGDNVYGQFDGDGSNFKALVELFEGFKKPWSLVYGNHDGEYFAYKPNKSIVRVGKGSEWQNDYLLNNTKYLRFEAGDAEMGNGNYNVMLEQDNKPLMSFTFMDTHGCDGYEVSGLNEKQLSWYEEEMKAINNKAGKNVPNLSFMHIPFITYADAMKSLGNETEVGVITDDGSLDKNGNFGANYEKFTPFKNGDLYWNKVKSLGVTKGIFVGHAHINNSSILYEGVRLTFGTKIGIYDYYRPDQQGGTLITIKDDASFTVKPILYK